MRAHSIRHCVSLYINTFCVMSNATEIYKNIFLYPLYCIGPIIFLETHEQDLDSTQWIVLLCEYSLYFCCY